MVGLLPLVVTATLPESVIGAHPDIAAEALERLRRRPDLLQRLADPTIPGPTGAHLLSAVNADKLRRILTRMLDERRFLSPHGLRAVSRWHLEHPYEFTVHGQAYTVAYEPAESTSGMFGGNSNWRGPVWTPVNTIIIRARLQFAAYYGDTFTIEYPTGSGTKRTLAEIAVDLAERMITIFTKDIDGHRPVFGGTDQFQNDPAWRDLLLVLRILPRRQRRRTRRVAPDRLDRPRRELHPTAPADPIGQHPISPSNDGQWPPTIEDHSNESRRNTTTVPSNGMHASALAQPSRGDARS